MEVSYKRSMSFNYIILQGSEGEALKTYQTRILLENQMGRSIFIMKLQVVRPYIICLRTENFPGRTWKLFFWRLSE